MDFIFQLIRCPNERKKKVPQDKIFRKYQGNSDYIEIRDFKMATTCSKRVGKKRIAEKDFIFLSLYFSFTGFNNIDYWGKIIRFKNFQNKYKRYNFCSLLFFIWEILNFNYKPKSFNEGFLEVFFTNKNS